MAGAADYLKRNSWNASCDRCGQKFKAEDLRLEWDNLMVCPVCFELRNPQDFVRATPDHQAPPWTRLMPTNNFIYVCDIPGRSAVFGYATFGCMVFGLIPAGFYQIIDEGPDGA